jgi:MFS transporter, YNFM family, putative membrane transport protein
MSQITASSVIPVHAAPQGQPGEGWIKPGTVEHRRAGTALFLAGFASFSLIYCVQPLLPSFAEDFGIGAARSSLALSLTTGLLAFSIMVAGALSQAVGRRELMFASMLLAAALNLVAAFAPGWNGFLAARALEGIVLGGVPAVAMAWLAEEIHPAHLGRTMGLYVAGTAFGAMIGRVGMGLMTEIASWRVALATLGILCILSAIGFLMLLPRSRNFVAQPGLSLQFHLQAWRGHLRNRRLWRPYATGAILTGVFVTLFNYTTFRLAGAPFGFDQTQISFIFLAFAIGCVSSTAAGRLVGRFGRRTMLMAGFAIMLAGVGLTLSPALPVIILGIVLVTVGFFINHSVTSSSVGPLAGHNRGHAASLYLLFYYLGASLMGWLGGWFWQAGGWPAVVGLTGALALTGLALSVATPTAPRG